MATFTTEQWAAAKHVIDAFTQDNIDENGLTKQQWSSVRDVVAGDRSLQTAKDESKVFFSLAQWSVVKDMVEGRSEVQNTVKEDSKVFFSPAQWRVVKGMVDGSRSVQSVKEDSKVFFSPAQWAVVKDAVDGKSVLNVPSEIAAR